jgi:hypothetical protein
MRGKLNNAVSIITTISSITIITTISSITIITRIITITTTNIVITILTSFLGNIFQAAYLCYRSIRNDSNPKISIKTAFAAQPVPEH